MRKRILVVDDDSAIRSSMQKVLESANYEVLLAKDGQEGLLISEGKTVDLLLIDLNLPLKSGWETMETVTERYPKLPIVLITGMVNQYERALAAGAGAVLEKPIEASTLLQTVQELVEETKEQRERRSSNTQLLKKLRDRAVTPYQWSQPRHTLPGAPFEERNVGSR